MSSRKKSYVFLVSSLGWGGGQVPTLVIFVETLPNRDKTLIFRNCSTNRHVGDKELDTN